MQNDLRPITILLADDSECDRTLTRKALIESRILNELREVGDGQELTDYLFHRGKYSSAVDAPRPGLILLGLDLPRENRSKTMQEIRSDPVLRHIPIVILTHSEREKDTFGLTELDMSSFTTKPLQFDALVETMRQLGKYWLEVVALPH